MLESLSHHTMRCSDITVKRALPIQSATGECYKGKLGLQQLTMVWMWKKVNELKDDVLYCSLLVDEVYIYIYIRLSSLPLQQHRFYLKQHCICNLNILKWNPKQQLRVTLNGYFTIHLNTVNVVAPFRQTLKRISVSVCFRGISRLPSAFVFLQWFKLSHISIQVCTFHDGCKQGIDQQIFNSKSISRKIYVILREINFLLKICWSIPCLHPSWKVHTFRQIVNLCCTVTRSQTKANTDEILGKIVYVIILAPCPHYRNNRNSVDYHFLLWIGKPIVWFDEQPIFW